MKISIHFKDINGKNYLLDDDGNVILFDSKEKAIEYVKEHGCVKDLIESLDFEEEKEP